MALYYLSSPFHGSDQQEAERARQAAQVCVALLKQHIPVFSPVVHNHALAQDLKLTRDQRRALLMPIDLELLRCASGMIILKLAGWQESQGMREEIVFCDQHSIAYYELALEDVLNGSPQFVTTVNLIQGESKN